MFTRRSLLTGVVATALMTPVLTTAVLGASAASEHHYALQLIATRVAEVLSTPVSPQATPDYVRMWSRLTAKWRTAQNLTEMVQQQMDAIFASDRTRWVKEQYGSVLHEGKLNTWFFSDILDRFPLYTPDLFDNLQMHAAFTILVPQYLR